jgi:hypothetical protein
VGGRTGKTLPGAEGSVWNSEEDENPEVVRRLKAEYEGRDRKMHEAVTSYLPNV